ncbi:Oidioi.mRNA.OKI2018_I69.PAR.g8476.t1.cds [Oikopleura dioica]|uniref:Oidioi.mRNA.OKI2018_I69.PAR.g8476.t1.cds n=1 Tax=Oikopleura dioica TaxID=34765 RepID=A0ABN7RG61_OIKDI|nr:Oidioi.mRNA.OKI2018_I69.PAR.g8476.t1.cds [Oikopleura dioica]
MKVFASVIAAACARSTMIIGGDKVEPNSEPYILSMQRFGSHFCGATLVSMSYGVCAAHCTYDPATVTALAGAHNKAVSEPTQQRKQLNKFLRNPDYRPLLIANDIAIVGWATPMEPTAYVVPLPIPAKATSEWLQNGWGVRVCGWGNIAYPQTNYPNELYCVDTSIVDVATCNSREAYNGSILPGMFCAGEWPTGGKDACQGDSGGPVTLMIDGVNHVIGATSWGQGCALPGYPGVYTDVAYYRDFVEQETDL